MHDKQSQIQIEIIWKQQRILFNEKRIIIVIVGTVLTAKITEITPFLSLTTRLVTEGLTMLLRAMLARARLTAIKPELLIKDHTIVDSCKTVSITVAKM